MAGLLDGDLEKIPEETFRKLGTTREEFRDIRRSMAAREERTPAAGTAAPDFEIERLSADGQRTGETFRLSEQLSQGGGRPVALVFGSYT